MNNLAPGVTPPPLPPWEPSIRELVREDRAWDDREWHDDYDPDDE